MYPPAPCEREHESVICSGASVILHMRPLPACENPYRLCLDSLFFRFSTQKRKNRTNAMRFYQFLAPPLLLTDPFCTKTQIPRNARKIKIPRNAPANPNRALGATKPRKSAPRSNAERRTRPGGPLLGR
jgi:hypothetical protein